MTLNWRPPWRSRMRRCFSFISCGSAATSTSSAAKQGAGLPQPKGASAKTSAALASSISRQFHYSVDGHQLGQVFFRQARRRPVVETLPESLHLPAVQRHSSGVPVAAEPAE